MSAVPKVDFSVNKYVNLFYHVSVLFSEYFSEEESGGFLNNQAYRSANAPLKTEKLHELFQVLQEYSFYSWDFMGKSLFEVDNAESIKKRLVSTTSDLVNCWLEIYSVAEVGYEEIWRQTEPKLKNYVKDFSMKWYSVGESVLHKMSELAKRPWRQPRMKVHLVDCLHGAAAWVNDVAVPPFPDFNVEMKLLAHELAHTLIPDYFLKILLNNLQLDVDMSHTIVDLVAYFSIKDHISDPDRRGIKPNPDYYKNVESLYPIFERCSKFPDTYQKLEDILTQVKK